MRLKKHRAVVAFQSQLSAILEKLMVLAVEEIKELVLDLCEEISHEQTTQTTDASEATRKDEEDGDFHTTDTFYPEPQDGHDDQDEPHEHVSQSCSMEEEKESHNYMKFPNAFSNSSQEALPDNCKFEVASTVTKNPSPYRREEECSPDGSRQSSFEPAEDTKSHLPNYNFPDETQCSSYDDAAPTNQDHSRDVVFQIKQEEETPGFETGDCTRFQMQTGQKPTEAPPPAQESFLLNPSYYYSSLNVASLGGFPRPMHLNPFAHTNRNKPNNTQASPQTNKVLFKCEFCDKTYRFPSLLKAHNLKHTQEKQLACRYCGKLFKWDYSLRRHERLYCGNFLR